MDSLRQVFEAAGVAPSSISTRAEVDDKRWKWDSQLMAGDVLVWVGGLHSRIVPFEHLKHARKVYTVYYQTEPLKGDIALDPDEVWDYSSRNLRKMNRTATAFVPIMHNPEFRTRHKLIRYGFGQRSTLPSPYDGATRSLPLVFFGNPIFRRESWSVLSSNSKTSPYLRSVHNVWTQAAYDQFVVSTPALYVNLHKKGSASLEGFRISPLLSHGALILSERCDDDDEEEYKGLVDFYDSLDELADAFDAMRQWNASQLQGLADERRRAFAERFSALRFRGVAESCLLNGRKRATGGDESGTATTTTTTTISSSDGQHRGEAGVLLDGSSAPQQGTTNETQPPPPAHAPAGLLGKLSAFFLGRIEPIL